MNAVLAAGRLHRVCVCIKRQHRVADVVLNEVQWLSTGGVVEIHVRFDTINCFELSRQVRPDHILAYVFEKFGFIDLKIILLS